MRWAGVEQRYLVIGRSEGLRKAHNMARKVRLGSSWPGPNLPISRIAKQVCKWMVAVHLGAEKWPPKGGPSSTLKLLLITYVRLRTKDALARRIIHCDGVRIPVGHDLRGHAFQTSLIQKRVLQEGLDAARLPGFADSLLGNLPRDSRSIVALLKSKTWTVLQSLYCKSLRTFFATIASTTNCNFIGSFRGGSLEVE